MEGEEHGDSFSFYTDDIGNDWVFYIVLNGSIMANGDSTTEVRGLLQVERWWVNSASTKLDSSHENGDVDK